MPKVEALATPDVLNAYLLDPSAVLPKNMRFYVGERGDFEKDTELAILVDPLTGQPYPLEPQTPSGDMDLHHGVHPRDHFVVQKTLGGRAMRCAQLQLANKSQHNEGPNRYHALEIGPLIHSEIGHQLGMCLTAVTGMEHRMAIHTSDKKMWLQPLSRWQAAQLRIGAELVAVTAEEVKVYRDTKHPDLTLTEAEARVRGTRELQTLMEYKYLRYGFKEISLFFKDCVLNQDLSNVNAEDKRRFINGEDDYAMLRRAVHELTSSMVTYSGDTLEVLYNRLWTAGRLNRLQPSDVNEVVLFKLGSDKSKQDLIDAMRDKLVLDTAA